MVKVPHNDPSQLLLAEHCQEGRDGESGEEDCLDLDRRKGRTGPLWNSGNLAPEGCVVDLAENDAEEGGRLVIGIGLNLGADLNNKCRGDHGE